MKNFLTFTGIILLSLIGCSSSLECYECDGESCVSESLDQVKCQEGAVYCLKLQLDEEFTKSCAYDAPQNDEEGCKEFGTTKTCYCKGDFCNSSNHVSALFSTLLLLLLLHILH
ncbi:uncharacterized protein LOC111707072 [Eurytemora carolleeae]|uniref:uncharacterized protein LOC111707072 n=1 Tax=Eurytemora carolleeae TaxID=1294199 RepID=UPI000C779ACB|nr:uncharacterized protein LOC111707072 [Eurytemora carolleeae]|eukprot:XP_023335839.1 uncharacterized protein LOC111707072 [Eurytemora affinis]